MEPKQFDRLARTFGEEQSRRGVLKAIAGGALGAVAAALGVAGADAKAIKRAYGISCSKNSDCSSNVCNAKDRHGRRVCGCGSTKECSSPGQCQTATCTAGVCGGQINTGASCSDGNFCTTGETCQSNGSCAGGSPVVCPPAISECYVAGTCNPSTGCSDPTYNNGVSCNSGEGVCADGDCVPVTSTSTSTSTTTETSTSTTTGTTETSTSTSTTTVTSTTTGPTGTTGFGEPGFSPASMRMSFGAHPDLAAFASAANNVSGQMRGKSNR